MFIASISSLVLNEGKEVSNIYSLKVQRRCWEMLSGWGAVDALVNYACSRRLLGISKRLSRSTGLAIREAIPCYSLLFFFQGFRGEVSGSSGPLVPLIT